MRSRVHQRFAYGDGLALGASVVTASRTTCIKRSACLWTSPYAGRSCNAWALRSRISFQGGILEQQSRLGSVVWDFNVKRRLDRAMI